MQEAEDGASEDSSSAHTAPSLAEGEAEYHQEVEFQGCGVPSAFADPGAYGDSDEADVPAEEDRLTDLPKLPLPLQMRGSGLRVSSLCMLCFESVKQPIFKQTLGAHATVLYCMPTLQIVPGLGYSLGPSLYFQLMTARGPQSSLLRADGALQCEL